MVLSDLEIRMEIGSGRLRFAPEIEWDQITPSSVDLRLGNTFTTFRPSPEGVATLVDLAKVGNVEEVVEAYGDTKTLTGSEAFLLEPGQFVLAFPSPIPASERESRGSGAGLLVSCLRRNGSKEGHLHCGPRIKVRGRLIAGLPKRCPTPHTCNLAH